MAKSKTRSEVEHLRGVVRELKKEIKRKEKREHAYGDLEEREAEALLKEEIADRKIIAKDECPNCHCEVETIEIGVVRLTICKNCNFRQTKRKK